MTDILKFLLVSGDDFDLLGQLPPGHRHRQSDLIDLVFDEGFEIEQDNKRVILKTTGGMGTQGPPGPPGEAGPAGEQGIQGIQGIQGPPGNDGQVGSEGPTGAQGEQGLQGIKGDTGDIGPQGPQGIQGEQGLQGMQGVQGLPGNDGSQGIQGPPGADSTVPGPPGPQGDQGIQGIQGPAGADSTIPGPQGIPGEQGEQGEQGIQGPQGIQGIQGSPGNDGAQGIQGDPGPQGDTGPQGSQGPLGPTPAQILVCAGSAALTWTNMPLAATFFGGANRNSMTIDLTNYTQVRFSAIKLATAGAAAAKLILRYFTSYSTTLGNYVDIGTSEVSVAVNVQNQLLQTGWINLIAGAKSNISLAIIGSGGDGTLDPQFGNIWAEFK